MLHHIERSGAELGASGPEVLKAACRAPQPARSALRRAVPGALHAAYVEARTERDAIGFKRTARSRSPQRARRRRGSGGGQAPRAARVYASDTFDSGRTPVVTPVAEPGRAAAAAPKAKGAHVHVTTRLGFVDVHCSAMQCSRARGAAPSPTAQGRASRLPGPGLIPPRFQQLGLIAAVGALHDDEVLRSAGELLQGS